MQAYSNSTNPRGKERSLSRAPNSAHEDEMGRVFRGHALGLKGHALGHRESADGLWVQVQAASEAVATQDDAKDHKAIDNAQLLLDFRILLVYTVWFLPVHACHIQYSSSRPRYQASMRWCLTPSTAKAGSLPPRPSPLSPSTC